MNYKTVKRKFDNGTEVKVGVVAVASEPQCEKFLETAVNRALDYFWSICEIRESDLISALLREGCEVRSFRARGRAPEMWRFAAGEADLAAYVKRVVVVRGKTLYAMFVVIADDRREGPADKDFAAQIRRYVRLMESSRCVVLVASGKLHAAINHSVLSGMGDGASMGRRR